MARDKGNMAMQYENKGNNTETATTAENVGRDLAIAVAGALIKQLADRYGAFGKVDGIEAEEFVKRCGGSGKAFDRFSEVNSAAKRMWDVPKEKSKEERCTAICCAWQTSLADFVALAESDGEDEVPGTASMATAFTGVMTMEFGKPVVGADKLADFLTRYSFFEETETEEPEPEDEPESEKGETPEGENPVPTLSDETVAAILAALVSIRIAATVEDNAAQMERLDKAIAEFSAAYYVG